MVEYLFGIVLTAPPGGATLELGGSPYWGLAISTSVALFFSMACSLFEAVLYSVPISTVRTGAETGDRRWVRMLAMKKEPAAAVSAILILNTVAHTAGATVAGGFASQIFDNAGMTIFSILLTLAILYLSEILPKVIGIVFCRELAPLVTGPITFMVFVLRPMIWFTELSTRGIKRGEGGRSEIPEWEMAAMMRQGVQDGAFREQEARLVESVLRLDTIRVREIMTPRSVVVALPADTIIAEAARHRGLWAHGRIPIHEDGLDSVIGIVLRRDVLINDDNQTETLRSLAREAMFVPETMRCDQLLNKLLAEQRSIAMVIDEYSQVEGLVTLEDVLETLLGFEIVDESDRVPDLREEATRLGSAKREQLGLGEVDPPTED